MAFYLFLKTENSRRVVGESRSVCMDLHTSISDIIGVGTLRRPMI